MTNMKALKKLKVLHDKILFKFLQDTTGNMFHEKTKFGFSIIENKDKQLKSPRWAQVIKAGKDVSEDIYPKLYILIEPLMWTTHIEYEGEKIWLTTEEKVIAVSDEIPIAI